MKNLLFSLLVAVSASTSAWDDYVGDQGADLVQQLLLQREAERLQFEVRRINENSALQLQLQQQWMLDQARQPPKYVLPKPY